ncbi:Ldh family oxidoreductase [uncultured Microbacterium sp.]|uniref:Ldh family oxidoreductase n=1 Tax=uncultured Microbacterium sp. TaxID=191216 RepID=UPI002602A0E3|nr:Ldh family oxidoreductase [uncultured Microbacterium sp.]
MSAPREVRSADLLSYATEILAREGVPDADAALVAESLVDANLRGVDSHGVSRIPIYVERIRRGLVNVHPTVEVIADRPAVMHVDGDNGLGQVVLARALELGLERMRETGAVTVSVRNSNHYGAGAFFARRAALAGAAALLLGNAPSTMVAWGGRERYLGTNPFTFAVPAQDRDPILLDMATSVVARGKIILADQLGHDIPEGWAVDPDGNPTTDTQAALDGSVLPFGGPKGYGIAMMVEIMSAILSGANSGPDVGDLYDDLDRPQGVGAFLHLVDPGAFAGGDAFQSRAGSLVSRIKATAVEGGEVLVPGEIEERMAAGRRDQGIPLPVEVLTALHDLSGIPFPAAQAGQKERV